MGNKMKKSTGGVWVLIIIIALAGALYLSKDAIIQKISQPAVEQEKKVWEQKAQQLEQEVNTLKEEIQKEEPSVPSDKLRAAFGEPPGFPALQKDAQCAELRTQVVQFFSYLDQKGYFKMNGIENSAYEHFTNVAEKLDKNRPIVSGETQDMYVLMRNIAFFYRMLGEKNIKLIIRIASKESDIIEPTMKLFYEWATPWGRCSETDGVRLSPEALYDYASFFLTTIAGHSYLARRDLKVRTLVVYYCVLILDKANQQNLNKYGIDISPHIDSVLNGIESQKGLAYKKDYVQTLHEIKKTYETLPVFR
jgi:hypothetical protein